jgi:hypothetical protein
LTDTLPEKTAFFSATGNYSLFGRTVTWDFGDLAALASEQVELAVRIPQATTGMITNTLYGAISDEVTESVRGAPVSTLIHEPAIGWEGDEDCANQWLQPGETLICLPELANLGNYTDTILISGSISYAEVTVTPTIITLGSGLNAPITVTITASVDALGGTEIGTTVTATSMADPDIRESLEIPSWIYHHLFMPLVFGEN